MIELSDCAYGKCFRGKAGFISKKWFPDFANYRRDGYRLYEYIENGALQTRKMNRILNTDYPVTEKANGKIDCFFPAERLEELLKERYGKQAGQCHPEL